MRAKPERHNGKNGPLVLKLIAESEADRVVLREFLAPLKGRAHVVGAVDVFVSFGAFDPDVHVDDLGPDQVTLSVASANPEPKAKG